MRRHWLLGCAMCTGCGVGGRRDVGRGKEREKSAIEKGKRGNE